MKKTYKQLTADQVHRGVIFSSTLVYGYADNEILDAEFTTHEVFRDGMTGDELKRSCDSNLRYEYSRKVMNRLTNDEFFNSSPFTKNVIRS